MQKSTNSFLRTLFLLFALIFTFNTDAQTKRILFQGFWWDYENNNYPDGWANYLTELAPRLRSMGINAVWLPPTVKNQSFGGTPGVGYAPFDHYDLGDKYQKGMAATRLGTKDELLRLVAVLHANGIEVVQDIVPNHIIGAGSETGAGGIDPASTNDQFSNFRYTSWLTPATDQSASDYLSRSGRFPKNYQNFHANPAHNCNSGDICQAFFGPDICYFQGAFGQSSNATFNPPQNSNHMRNGMRNWLIWNMKQMGFDGVRIDAVKHFEAFAAEDFLFNLQNQTGFAAKGDNMFAVGEYVGGTSDVDNWYSAVQGRAGVFDFSLRAFDNDGGLYGMVYGLDAFDMTTLAGAQQTEGNRIHLTGVHRTVPFVNNHDTFRPQKDASGNYTGWNTGDELSAHIEPNEPRLAAAYAVIHAMDGNPQVFFEDLFNIGYLGNRFSHDPKSETSLPVREDLVNIMQCHQKLDFKSGAYKVRSAEPFDGGAQTGVFVVTGNLSDHFVVERSGKAVIGVTDNFTQVQEVFIDTDFAPGTVLMDYSGANGLTQYTVPADGRTRIITQPVNYPADVADQYHGYSVWAPVPNNVPFTSLAAMQAHLDSYTQPLSTITTQEWEMANDLGDSHCLSLMQGGALPANSTNSRTVGKIFVQAGTTVSYTAEPQTDAAVISFFNLDGDELHTATGTGSISGSFNASYTGWVTARLRNAAATTPEQTAIVRLTYTAPQTVNTFNFPTEITSAIWTGNAGTTDTEDCRNWEEGFIPDANTNVLVPAYANPKPAFNGTLSAQDLEIEPGVDFQVTGTLDIHGDFINNGTLSGCGTVRFVGNSPQTATGSSNFCILELDNGADLTLGNANTVSQELRLTDGNYILTNGNLTLLSGATVTGGSPSAYVQTPDMPGADDFLVREVGNTATVFPVGNDTYNPVVLVNTGTTRNFSVRAFNGIYANGTSGAELTEGEQVNQSWEISPDGTGVSTDVTLQWNGAEEGADFNRPAAVIIKNDGAEWVNQTTGAAAGSDPYTVTAAGITSFSAFAVVSDNALLPVELLSFTGSQKENDAVLEWTTVNEIDNAGFSLEKSHFGHPWKELTFVNGTNDRENTSTYRVVDTEFTQPTYYRLRQIDRDGTETLSQVVFVEKPCQKLTFSVQPNPFTSEITITAGQPEIEGYTMMFRLSDAAGNEIWQQKTSLTEAQSRLNALFAKQPKGIYFLQIAEGEVLKLVKE